MENEIWKEVKDYEGMYQDSDLGNVRSLNRVTNNNKRLKGRLLKLVPNTNGYLTVNFCLNGKPKTKKIHQLVAETFLNHTPCGHKAVVDHIDNDKTNNKLENLQVITNRANTSKDRVGGVSKYVGVSFHSRQNKYIAHCYHNGKHVHLGYFTDEIEASEAYNNYLKTIK